jgi:hypothetical protein
MTLVVKTALQGCLGEAPSPIQKLLDPVYPKIDEILAGREPHGSFEPAAQSARAETASPRELLQIERFVKARLEMVTERFHLRGALYRPKRSSNIRRKSMGEKRTNGSFRIAPRCRKELLAEIDETLVEIRPFQKGGGTPPKNFETLLLQVKHPVPLHRSVDLFETVGMTGGKEKHPAPA